MNMKRSSRRSLTAFALKGLIIGDDNLQKADSTDLKSRHEAAQIAKEAEKISIARGRCVAEIGPNIRSEGTTKGKRKNSMVESIPE